MKQACLKGFVVPPTLTSKLMGKASRLTDVIFVRLQTPAHAHCALMWGEAARTSASISAAIASALSHAT